MSKLHPLSPTSPLPLSCRHRHQRLSPPPATRHHHHSRIPCRPQGQPLARPHLGPCPSPHYSCSHLGATPTHQAPVSAHMPPSAIQPDAEAPVSSLADSLREIIAFICQYLPLIQSTFTALSRSILSPLLFALHIADLKIPPATHMIQYTDDTYILSSSIHEHMLSDRLSRGLTSLQTQLHAHSIGLNHTKSEAVLYSRHHPTEDHPPRLSTTAIPWSPLVRYLGIIFDSHFNFIPHLDSVTTKARTAMIHFAPVLCPSSGTSPAVRLTVFRIFITPILTYACPTWSHIITHALRHPTLIFFCSLRLILRLPLPTHQDQVLATACIPHFHSILAEDTDRFRNSCARHLTNPLIRQLATQLPFAPFPRRQTRFIAASRLGIIRRTGITTGMTSEYCGEAPVAVGIHDPQDSRGLHWCPNLPISKPRCYVVVQLGCALDERSSKCSAVQVWTQHKLEHCINMEQQSRIALVVGRMTLEGISSLPTHTALSSDVLRPGCEPHVLGQQTGRHQCDTLSPTNGNKDQVSIPALPLFCLTSLPAHHHAQRWRRGNERRRKGTKPVPLSNAICSPYVGGQLSAHRTTASSLLYPRFRTRASASTLPHPLFCIRASMSTLLCSCVCYHDEHTMAGRTDRSASVLLCPHCLREMPTNLIIKYELGTTYCHCVVYNQNFGPRTSSSNWNKFAADLRYSILEQPNKEITVPHSRKEETLERRTTNCGEEQHTTLHPDARGRRCKQCNRDSVNPAYHYRVHGSPTNAPVHTVSNTITCILPTTSLPITSVNKFFSDRNTSKFPSVQQWTELNTTLATGNRKEPQTCQLFLELQMRSRRHFSRSVQCDFKGMAYVKMSGRAASGTNSLEGQQNGNLPLTTTPDQIVWQEQQPEQQLPTLTRKGAASSTVSTALTDAGNIGNRHRNSGPGIQCIFVTIHELRLRGGTGSSYYCGMELTSNTPRVLTEVAAVLSTMPVVLTAVPAVLIAVPVVISMVPAVLSALPSLQSACSANCGVGNCGGGQADGREACLSAGLNSIVSVNLSLVGWNFECQGARLRVYISSQVSVRKLSLTVAAMKLCREEDYYIAKVSGWMLASIECLELLKNLSPSHVKDEQGAEWPTPQIKQAQDSDTDSTSDYDEIPIEDHESDYDLDDIDKSGYNSADFDDLEPSGTYSSDDKPVYDSDDESGYGSAI
ncbi:hypothetical protein PR048_023572 [Dryococelus australis]|uniref:Reverse transcriptase domain-containing protein n=1 Tax=Dryococelus australis TaxID=614101 RepID=A0ABQ9GUG9_9NEOP|nr:hypothetical protein PR048_023572 [Dryococelus australis]